MLGKASHMHLVDDCFAKRSIERLISFPVEGAQVADHAFHGCSSIVTRLRGFGATVAGADMYTLRIRIKQNLLRIESLTVLRVLRPVDAVSVELAAHDSRHEDMPV